MPEEGAERGEETAREDDGARKVEENAGDTEAAATGRRASEPEPVPEAKPEPEPAPEPEAGPTEGSGRSRSRGRRGSRSGGGSRSGNGSRQRADAVEREAQAAEDRLQEQIRMTEGAAGETIDGPAPERTAPVNGNDERRIALFCDLENIALGVRDSDIKKLDIHLVLERLLEKGKIIVKKAYADWERYSEFKRPLHEAAIEMIDIPQKYYSGKNSADIKMAVDALELCYSKDHVDTFAILSGDSDFSPLVSKLRESNKRVIGVGVKNSSSNLLIDNCDEFLFYEDIWREQQTAPRLSGLDKKKGEAFSLMIESMKALMRENKEVLWGSMIKQTMQRKRPSFNEGYHGYSSFSDLLEDAERNNIIKLKRDQRSGTYIVTGFAGQR